MLMDKILCIVALLFLQFSLPLNAQEIPSARLINEYNRAWGLIEQQKYDRALIILKEIISRDKTFCRAYSDLGYAYERKKDLAEAERYFHLLLDSDRQNGCSHYGLGGIYSAQKDYTRAIEQYEKCIQLLPNWQECYRQLGSVFAAQEAKGIAADDLKKMIDENPNNPALYLSLGQMYSGQDQWSKALEAYYIGLQKVENQNVKFKGVLLKSPKRTSRSCSPGSIVDFPSIAAKR